MIIVIFPTFVIRRDDVTKYELLSLSIRVSLLLPIGIQNHRPILSSREHLRAERP